MDCTKRSIRRRASWMFSTELANENRTKPLPYSPKDSPEKTGYAGFFQGAVGELAACQAGAFDIGEGVERALGRGAADAFYGVEAVHDDVAAAGELFHHAVGCVLRSLDGFEGCVLREAGGAGYAVGY